MLLLNTYAINAQTVYSAINQDNVVHGGLYSNIMNTGVFINTCSSCVDDYMVAMCWDGDDPGVAFFDGLNDFSAALPTGAHDPDIVVGVDGTTAIVVYELNGDVVYSLVSVTAPLSQPPTVGSPIIIDHDATHPNIDISNEDILAVVWRDENPQSNPSQIRYNVGKLNSSSISWLYINESADNKNINPLEPMQPYDCYWPDISISSLDGAYGVHITFIEEEPTGEKNWWKMNDDFGLAAPSIGKQWHTAFVASTNADLMPPRICASKAGGYFPDGFQAVLANLNNPGTATDKIFLVADNNVSNWTFADFNIFYQKSHFPVVAWVDDGYVNVCWSVDEPNITDHKDIVVKRFDHQAVEIDYTWSIVNQGTQHHQFLPSIDGVNLFPTSQHTGLFAYFWVDSDDLLWFKVATDVTFQFKNQPITVEKVFVYPNPTDGLIHIKLPDSIDMVNSVIIKDTSGKIVKKAFNFLPPFTIDIHDMPSDFYFLEIESNQGIERIKLLKH